MSKDRWGWSDSERLIGDLRMSKDKWVERWKVKSDSEDITYTVARDVDGHYGCSCPAWKFKRKMCKHIHEILSSHQIAGVNRATEEKRVIRGQIEDMKKKSDYRDAMVKIKENAKWGF